MEFLKGIVEDKFVTASVASFLDFFSNNVPSEDDSSGQPESADSLSYLQSLSLPPSVFSMIDCIPTRLHSKEVVFGSSSTRSRSSSTAPKSPPFSAACGCRRRCTRWCRSPSRSWTS